MEQIYVCAVKREREIELMLGSSGSFLLITVVGCAADAGRVTACSDSL